MDSVQNNTDFKFISSGVGGGKKGMRVCLFGLLLISFIKFYASWNFYDFRDM
jgi:hypothetical protein